MSHPSVNCAHQLPSMGANKPLLEERCHAVTEWWLFYFLGDHTKKGRPMVAPTNNDYSVFFISKAPSVTKRATDGRPYERRLFRFLYRKCYSIQKGDQESPLRIIFF